MTNVAPGPIDADTSPLVHGGGVEVDAPAGGQIGQLGAIFTLTNTWIGAGAVGVPYAFALAGFGLSLGLLAFVVALVMLAGVLLFRCLEHDKMKEESTEVDFGLLGKLAFGEKGQAGINAVFATELWLATCIFFILIGVNSNFVFGVESWQAIIVSGVLTLALLYVPMGILALLSFIGVLFMGLLLAVLVHSGNSMPVHAGKVEQYIWTDWAGSGQALGVFLLCFAGMPCVPSIYSAAQDKRRFPVAFNVSCVLAMLYYAAFGTLGYFFYGSNVKEVVTVNLGHAVDGSALEGTKVLPLVAAVGLIVKLQATIPIVVNPVMAALGWSGIFLQILTIAISTAVAIGLRQYVDAAMSITGLSATMASCVLFPIAVYIKICKPPVVIGLSLGLLCVLAAVVAVLGSVQTIMQTITDIVDK